MTMFPSFLFLNFLMLLFCLSILLIITKFFNSKTNSFFKPKSKKGGGGAALLLLPPSPPQWPLLHNLPDFLANKPVFRWIHDFMKEINSEISSIRLGNVHIVMVTSPELSREFLKKHDAIFSSRPLTMATEYSSSGYLSVAVVPKGDQWKKMRRVIASHVINQTTFKWMHDKRSEEADNLVRFTYNKIFTSESVINVRNIVRQYSGNVIRKMMFNTRYFGEGKKDGGPGMEEEEHVESLFTVLAHLYAFSLSDYFPWMRFLDLDGHERTVKQAMNAINKYHDPIVDKRIEMWRNGEKKEAEDLLDILISIKDDNGEPLLSVAEIKSQCNDLTFAAVDNPSNAVEWAMAEMLNQPEVMKKAVEEIDRVVGKERLVQESDLEKLNYVKACARESFRLHPMSPFNLPHVSTSDAVVAGYYIPKGSHVLLSRIGLGRNGRVWEEPLRFKPERHMGVDGDGKVDLTETELRFISFSAGRRGCLGVSIGSAMTGMLLARLLQGFTWSRPKDEAIDLSESRNDLSLAKPLLAMAKPRLHPSLYCISSADSMK